jgi:hypothetical protein
VTVDWTDERLARVTTLCLGSHSGLSWLNVVNCFGELHSGARCSVRLPFEQLQKGRERVTIVQHAKEAKVFAGGLGLLEAITYVIEGVDSELASDLMRAA